MRKNFQFSIFNFQFFLLFLFFYILHSPVYAASPTPTPKLTPTASPPATLTPTSTEDEKVQEIREAINQKVQQIKEKIEKKAYVGNILEITDSTITLSNFRGKQRVRITEATTLIGSDKKTIKVTDLAVGDKVIALGEISENEILEAKRVIVVPARKTATPKRLVINGKITTIDTKKSAITVTSIKNLDETIDLKIDKGSSLISQKDPKAVLKLKDLAPDQRAIVVYPEPAEGKSVVAKTIFILP